MKKKKKAKDAVGSSHNLANQKNQATAKKFKDNRTVKKATAEISSKTPNNFGRSGNDADRELEVLRGMDKKHLGMQKKKR